MSYLNNEVGTFSTKSTPQNKPLVGEKQVQNYAGGYVYEIDKWTHLRRFLILGTEGGSYYVDQSKLTEDSCKNVIACIKEDGVRAVNEIVEISDQGRAPKNDPAIFTLALACTHGDDKTKKVAYNAITKVCRIGTHLFTFMELVTQLRGWSRGLREGVAKYYTERDVDSLGYQLVKYQNRGTWSHHDVLNLIHPVPVDDQMDTLFGYIVKKDVNIETLPKIVGAFEDLKKYNKDRKKAVEYIKEYNLPREAIPTELLNDVEVWEALLEKMPMTALIRNLGKMSSIGLVSDNLQDATKKVVSKLTNADELHKARVHPISVLMALKTYAQGKGMKGKLSWVTVPNVVDALNEAFHMSFKNVEPTGKNYLLGIDVSSSMEGGWGTARNVLSSAEMAAAMAMVTARTESNYSCMGFADIFRNLGITPRMSLTEVLSRTRAMNFGSTDCSLPMTYAGQKNLPVDVFIVYCVDTETEILASGGWKKYDSLKESEEVYTLNHDTGMGEWDKVKAVNIFPEQNREMLLMEGRTHSSLTTMNHRWPVRHRGNSEWGRRWKTSETLNMVDYIQCAAEDSGLPKDKKWSDAFVELMAWAWTEGSWNQSKAMSICQSFSKNKEFCDRIRSALVEYYGPSEDSLYGKSDIASWREDIREEKNMIYWHLNQKASEDFYEIMNGDKVISLGWFRELTKDQLKSFINVSFLADGDIKKMRLAQANKERSEVFAFACILAGYSVSYCDIDNDHNKSLEIGVLQRSQFAPLQHANNIDRPFKVEKINHVGKVWCPTTNNGTWLARRNGSVYWTGNTDNETWSGRQHPVQALRAYRQKSGRDAKLIVAAFESGPFTIADPNDKGMLDVAGCDASIPQIIREFSLGKI